MSTGPTMERLSVRATKFVARDVLFDVLHFPIWWYTIGTAQAWRFIVQEILQAADRLSLRILMRNFFKPMYGDYSRSGRAISFFMRLIMFVFKTIWMVIWAVLLLGVFIVWLVAMPAIVYQLARVVIG